MNSERNSSFTKFFAGVVIGGAIGSVLGFFLSKKHHERTIRDVLNDAVENINDARSDFFDRFKK